MILKPLTKYNFVTQEFFLSGLSKNKYDSFLKVSCFSTALSSFAFFHLVSPLNASSTDPIGPLLY